MINGEILFIFKTILKLIFQNFRNILIHESYLIDDFEKLKEEIETIEDKKDILEFKEKIKVFFENYCYFFEFNFYEERSNLKKILIELDKLTNELFIQADSFKEKIKEFENSIEKLTEKKDVQEILVLFKQSLKEITAFIDYFISEIMVLKDSIKDTNNKVMSFEKKILDLRKKAFIDELTGVYNRRGLEVKLKQILNEFVPGKDDFAIIMVDLNNFKKINDKYGHLAGDKILRIVADLMKKAVRAEDFVCRYGGDEFIIIISGVKKPIAVGIAKRILEKITNAKFIYNNHELKVELSAGMYYVDKPEEPKIIIDKADKAMYEAKQKGEKLKIV